MKLENGSVFNYNYSLSLFISKGDSMASTVALIKEWQEALQIEINYLKKVGSNNYKVLNGRLVSTQGSYSYYFDTVYTFNIPIGSVVRLEWGNVRYDGRMLSSEGRGIILSFEQSLGDLVGEAVLYHDPWELLDKLIERLDEIKKSKKKRVRIKRLMDPSMKAKHPSDKTKGNIHEVVLRSKYNPVTFIWGPPGTGKTYTLARVAANKYFKEQKVLIVSQSNQAVDVLLSEISTFIKKKNKFKEGDIIRYGTSTRLEKVHADIATSPLIEKHDPKLAESRNLLVKERQLLKQDLVKSFSVRDTDTLLELEKKIVSVLEKIRSREIQLVKEAQLIGTTIAKAAGDPVIFEQEFDVVIVDEASMAYVPQTAFVATLGKHVIVCGDFKQLPPIAASRHQLVNYWLREDIFHRAGVVDWVENGKLHPHLFLLKEQRRMHPDISAFTNNYIYHSLVGDYKDMALKTQKITCHSPFPNQASILLDTSSTGAHCITERSSKSRMNLWNLFISFQLIYEAYLDGVQSIGYVTPYRAQAKLMEFVIQEFFQKDTKGLDIISATVHRFQGSERDVMVFDTVDGDPMDRPGMLLVGNDSERLMNVAITRTKGKFINVCDSTYIKSTISRVKTLRQLVDYQEKHNQVVTPNEIGSWITEQHPRLQWIYAKRLECVFQDIFNARQSIVMSISSDIELSTEWIKHLEKRRQGVSLTIISGKEPKAMKVNNWINCSIPFSFVAIDQRYFWLGMPLEYNLYLKPPYVAVRVDSNVVTDQILSQIPM